MSHPSFALAPRSWPYADDDRLCGGAYNCPGSQQQQQVRWQRLQVQVLQTQKGWRTGPYLILNSRDHCFQRDFLGPEPGWLGHFFVGINWFPFFGSTLGQGENSGGYCGGLEEERNGELNERKSAAGWVFWRLSFLLIASLVHTFWAMHMLWYQNWLPVGMVIQVDGKDLL